MTTDIQSLERLAADDPEALARLLELERRCERCKTRNAAALFDRQFLCRRCRLAAEIKLALEAQQSGSAYDFPKDAQPD